MTRDIRINHNNNQQQLFRFEVDISRSGEENQCMASEKPLWISGNDDTRCGERLRRSQRKRRKKTTLRHASFAPQSNYHFGGIWGVSDGSRGRNPAGNRSACLMSSLVVGVESCDWCWARLTVWAIKSGDDSRSVTDASKHMVSYAP